MRCPTLAKLPPPPSGKTGWPWTEESPCVPDRMQDGRKWPRISIVTPSYNQGRFIEETIRSVILQGYPNLEYIIIDGGSTDDATEVIRKYESHLAYWVSEKDRGQTDAINKGFARATGDILAWINSDDLYFPGALSYVGNFFARRKGAHILTGAHTDIDARGKVLGYLWPVRPSFHRLLCLGMHFGQPASFWSKRAYERVGGMDTSMDFCMDYDLMLRMTRYYRTHSTRVPLACFRVHKEAKSSNLLHIRDKEDKMLHQRFGKPDVSRFRHKWEWFKYRAESFLHSRWQRATFRWRFGSGYPWLGPRDMTFQHLMPGGRATLRGSETG